MKYWSGEISKAHFTLLGLGALLCSGYSQVIEVPLSLDGSAVESVMIESGGVSRLRFEKEKPSPIRREPSYKERARYGSFKLGYGVKSIYNFSVDPQKDGYRVYLDRNQNGDLRDDEPLAALAVNIEPFDGQPQIYETKFFSLSTSWNIGAERTQVEYMAKLVFYGGADEYVVLSGATLQGPIYIGGRTYSARVIDPYYLATSPHVGEEAHFFPDRPMLLVDFDGTGEFDAAPERGTPAKIFELDKPVSILGRTYETALSVNRSQLRLTQTNQASSTSTALLARGSIAPEIVIKKDSDSTFKLSEHRGRVVILTFWATWCGPSQPLLAEINRLTQLAGYEGVSFVGICLDSKEAYSAWMEKNNGYKLPLLLAPSTADLESRYGLRGSPTTYIIGTDGKVVDAYVGFGRGDTRIQDALKRIVVKE